MRKVFFCALGALVLVSCNSATLEEEMDDYCECVSANSVGSSVCNKIADRINETYAFDPESVEYIEQRLQECSH